MYSRLQRAKLSCNSANINRLSPARHVPQSLLSPSLVNSSVLSTPARNAPNHGAPSRKTISGSPSRRSITPAFSFDDNLNASLPTLPCRKLFYNQNWRYAKLSSLPPLTLLYGRGVDIRSTVWRGGRGLVQSWAVDGSPRSSVLRAACCVPHDLPVVRASTPLDPRSRTGGPS